MPEKVQINVFVVEDSPVTLTILKNFLSRQEGFNIVGEASDGASAVEGVRQLRPDVVLMDIGLPVLNGIDATRQIIQEMPDARVVMLTVSDNDQNVFQALAAGAHGYCVQSPTEDSLLTAIRTVFDGGAWLDPKIARRVLQACTVSSPLDGEAEAQTVSLSQREQEVLRLVVDGKTNQQIAEHLYLSVETVKSHLRHVMDKLRVSDRTQAAVKAVRERLV